MTKVNIVDELPTDDVLFYIWLNGVGGPHYKLTSAITSLGKDQELGLKAFLSEACLAVLGASMNHVADETGIPTPCSPTNPQSADLTFSVAVTTPPHKPLQVNIVFGEHTPEGQPLSRSLRSVSDCLMFVESEPIHDAEGQLGCDGSSWEVDPSTEPLYAAEYEKTIAVTGAIPITADPSLK